MAASIGIRVYKITVNKKGNSARLPFSDKSIVLSPSRFVSDFIKRHPSPTRDDELERSWYFEQKEETSTGSSRGYVHYGTFGFESKLKDSSTKRLNYKRKVTDVEEIPLFYEFWFPPASDFGFVAFQSFSGRSCISMIMTLMREEFFKKNDGISLQFERLIPSDGEGSLFFNSPVKRLRLYKRNVSSDIADRILTRGRPMR